MANGMSAEIIASRIFEIRGKKVMIDRDLAALYGVETRILNQAVRRNIERFPGDFMFSLTRMEIMDLSQTVISSKIKHAPNVFVFTQEGVAMLSSVLNSGRAIKVNIQIMRAFVKLRELLLTHKELAIKIEGLEKKYAEHDEKIIDIFEAIRQLLVPPKVTEKRIIRFQKS
ncbi:MAG: ORF6N domain-containing protein [Candidatus Omnitrophica bacterium]|nr:ORF6N domain-containing protein [Candidatus Omnitrophota bacterium]